MSEDAASCYHGSVKHLEQCRQMGKRNITHGLSYSPEYEIWNAARKRCHTPTSRAYPSYGARGIYMCDRWRFGKDGKTGFECFYEDIGARPNPDLQLERKDNDCKENCEWVDRKRQQNNRRPPSQWNNAKPRKYGQRRGVSFDPRRNKWYARKYERGNGVYLGSYDTEAEAANVVKHFEERRAA